MTELEKEFDWKPWKFKRVPSSYWRQFARRLATGDLQTLALTREFVQWAAAQCQISIESDEKWKSKLTQKSNLPPIKRLKRSLGGHAMFNRALDQLFPTGTSQLAASGLPLETNSTQPKRKPRGFWNSSNERRAYFDSLHRSLISRQDPAAGIDLQSLFYRYATDSLIETSSGTCT